MLDWSCWIKDTFTYRAIQQFGLNTKFVGEFTMSFREKCWQALYRRSLSRERALKKENKKLQELLVEARLNAEHESAERQAIQQLIYQYH